MDIPILNNIISNEYLNINTLSPTNRTTLTNTTTTTLTNNDGKSIFAVFHMFISILAFYLALRCNSKINYRSIIIALFLPYPYVIYSIIMYNGICKI